jgi:hypothetical protein
MIRLPHRSRALAVLVFLAALAAAGDSHAFVVSGTIRNAQAQGVAGVDIDAVNSQTGLEVPLTGDGSDANGF